MNCGGALAAPSPDDRVRQDRLGAAAPASLVEKMRAAGRSGERKPVTALFADVVGSTALAERLDPEDWTGLINSAFDLMSQAVFRYEGTIAQLQGDAMLAFFGAPVAHEDDPERAVLAALDMVEAVDAFAAGLPDEPRIDFRIRVGINTGPVVVGTVGTDLRYEYTALGDTMNVAARLQAAAEPGSILITAATKRLVAHRFDLRDVGPLSLKGKASPVGAFEVLARRAIPATGRGVEGLASPMVGRETDLERLVTILGQAQAGEGRAAFVTGEPGIGKSRLLAEFRHRALEPGAGRWVEGRCLSYGRGLPYHLVLDVVRSFVGIAPGTDRPAANATLDAWIADLGLGGGSPRVALPLAHLLSLPMAVEEQAGLERLDPEALQARYLEALRAVIVAAAERQPTVLVCEDVHWADASSVETLGRLLPLLAALPVLVIVTSRPDRDSETPRLLDAARRAFTGGLLEVELAALSDADGRRLVGNLLEIESLPADVRDLIIVKAEGNPFFVEELIRMLIDRGVLVRREGRWKATEGIETVEIPDTLHSLLLARIDGLPEAARSALRLASVIGRQFPMRVLGELLEARPA